MKQAPVVIDVQEGMYTVVGTGIRIFNMFQIHTPIAYA